jgi:guanylate kinase
MDYPGNLFVVAAPSGAGKSSLVKALLELDAHVQPSVSHTTRAPRGQERHGREYFFVSEQEFDAMVAADGFLEWAHVHNHRYGTSKRAIEERMAQGADVILEIDYQGAIQSRKFLPTLSPSSSCLPVGKSCVPAWNVVGKIRQPCHRSAHAKRCRGGRTDR